VYDSAMRWLLALPALSTALLWVPAASAVRPSVVVVGCAQHVEAAGPRPSTRDIREARRASIIAGAITFWGLRRAQHHAFEPGGARRDKDWKAGVSVHCYRAVTVRVAAQDRAWVGLD
jgi:hypothetical protein